MSVNVYTTVSTYCTCVCVRPERDSEYLTPIVISRNLQ